jgi:hypothetical protein
MRGSVNTPQGAKHRRCPVFSKLTPIESIILNGWCY